MSQRPPQLKISRTVKPVAEAPSSERAFLFDEHTSYTGQARARWRYYPAVGPDASSATFVLANGHLGVMESYIPFAEAAASLGINTVIMGPPGSQKVSHAYHPDHFLHPERLAAQMFGRITRDVVEIYGVDQLDIGGHSKGLPAVVAAALRWPKRFRSVTSHAGAGMTGHGFWDLASRVPRVMRDIASERSELQRNLGWGIVGKTGLYVARNFPRVMGESVAVTQSDARPGLIALGELGVLRAAIVCGNDGFFPADITQKLCGDMLDFIHSLDDKSHTVHQSSPEEVAAAQADVLRAFEELPLAG